MVTILAAVDDTTASDDVLRTAGVLAAALKDAELHLVRVTPPMPVVMDGSASLLDAEHVSATDALVAEHGREAASLANDARRYFRGTVVSHVVLGSPAHAIVELAVALEADVIVVGPNHHGRLARWLRGSVSERVVRAAPCSVVVARRKEHAPEIEPPCPDCLAARRDTGDITAWCARHARHHVHAELHYEIPPSFGVGSMFLRP